MVFVSRRPRSYRWRSFGAVAMALAAVWLFGLFLFVERIAHTVPIDRATDAVVVLTGGAGRIDRGAELLAQAKARQMLISGVGTDVPLEDLLSDRQLSRRLLDCCVTLGRAARDTHENAIETAGWAASRNVESIRLVTADFHMPRSLLEFRSGLPGILIVPEPVSSPNIRIDGWWRRPATASLIAGEYTKYLATRAHKALINLIDDL